MPRRSPPGTAAERGTPEGVPACVRIAVVDDRDVVRRGLADQLRELGGYELAVSVATGEELLHACRSGCAVDLALVHVQLGGVGGMATLGLLHRAFPRMSVLALCDLPDEDDIARAVRAHARGVLLVRLHVDELRAALADARAGRWHINSLLERHLLTRRSRSRSAPNEQGDLLSPRELEVLQLLAHRARYTRRLIAKHMHLSENTVRTHLRHIFGKMRVRSSRAAVRRGEQWGLLG